MLCSNLLDVEWTDDKGRHRKSTGNLEDISLSGACVQVERPIPLNTHVRIAHPQGNFKGTVRYCIFRDLGYFLGIEFEPGSKWTQGQFRPQHMLDPRTLLSRVPKSRQES